MKKSGKAWQGALSLFVTLAMAFASVPSIAFANEEPSDQTPEWAVDDGTHDEAITAQAEIPTAYDMRTEGLVTPVKLQNPWSSCWAFGGIAAAEISILSSTGMSNKDAGIDLSERHLTWFGLHPVTELENPAQMGEGLHLLDESPNAAFNAGGRSIFITTLFSQGVGPLSESMFPYRGNNAVTTLDVFEAHADERTRAAIEASADAKGMTYEQYLASAAAEQGVSEDEVYESVKAGLRQRATDLFTYSENDDWSISATDESGASNRLLNGGYVLKDGNILPDYWRMDNDVPTQINTKGIDAIKQELLNGHGVSISYYADQSGRYSMSNDKDGFLFCQYVDEYLDADHGVCIVGWDDNYDASTFTHTTDRGGNPLTDNKGNPLTEEQARELTTPPGNGAWIVKNSWGSTSDACKDDLGNDVNRFEYGAKNAEGEYTGYFYLSYYDKTIRQSETSEFSANLGTGGFFYTLQHDYLPSTAGFLITKSTESVQSAANVFETDQSIAVQSISTRTSEANMRVTYAVYLLNDNAQEPTDGTLLLRTSRNYEYGGFHRLDLDQPFKVPADKRFSIVSTASKLGDNGMRLYSTSASMGATREYVERYNAATQPGEGKLKYYSVAVVNKNESFYYSDGKWQDWATAQENLKAAVPYYNDFEIDNFSIKAYAEPAEDEPEPEPEPQTITLTYGGHAQTVGDLPEASDGDTCGTTGKSKRLEALWAEASEGTVEYRGHVQGIGWEETWAKNGESCGTTGQSKRVEAVQMRLKDLDDCHVWYRVHSQTFGWLGWAKDGEPAGTSGLSKRVEAYQAVIIRGDATPIGYDESEPAYVGATIGNAHVQGIGWTGKVQAGLLGTTGQSKRVEAISLVLPGQPWDGGITYEVHAQGKGWMKQAADGKEAGTTGQSRRLEAMRIQLTGDVAEHLSVWYRVHSQSFGWLGWACDGEDAGTTGLSKRAEAIEVQLLPKGTVPKGYDPGTDALRS